jgi:Phage integrase family
MFPEVGNAIIDYLKYGRPQSNDTHVFICTKPPYTRIYSWSITGSVHKCLVRAGISIENRKHGPHTLRHSLASRLLERGTIVPVISEVLGHENTESTRYYLRIDLKSMRQCCLEVPMVPSSFYEQKDSIKRTNKDRPNDLKAFLQKKVWIRILKKTAFLIREGAKCYLYEIK